MKIIVDKNIPFIKGLLEPYGEVLYLPGKDICFENVVDADAILVRTRTKCNAHLLEKVMPDGSVVHSKVSFIASATIGTDHIDLDYLSSRGISFSNAPGCNAGGVMQYVLTALYAVAQRKGIDLSNKTLGVVGLGNTGSRVAALAEHLGFNVLKNDPPRALKESIPEWNNLDYLLSNSDIISFHVPLDDSTLGFVDSTLLSKLKKGAIFINASRGEIVCEDALLKRLEMDISALILDVWNGEPSAINKKLVEVADIATPHIAGYSFEGKVNGTVAVLRALARHFSISALTDYEYKYSTETPFLRTKGTSQSELCTFMLDIFPVLELDKMLRQNPSDFEKIRGEYNYRREFRYE